MEFVESVYQPTWPDVQYGPTLRRRVLHWHRRSMWLDAPPPDSALASMTNIPHRRDHSKRSKRNMGDLGRLVRIRKYTGLGKMMAETPFLRIADWGKIPPNLYIIRSTSFDLRDDKTYRDGNETREIDPI